MVTPVAGVAGSTIMNLSFELALLLIGWPATPATHSPWTIFQDLGLRMAQ
jgi:hypothetical protein